MFCVALQGPQTAQQAGTPEQALPQPASEPAIVTWESFKSLAKPGDRLRLVGNAPPLPQDALGVSQTTLALPGNALHHSRDAQPVSGNALHGFANALPFTDSGLSSAQHSVTQQVGMSTEAALSSAHGIVTPAGSSRPLVTDADVANWIVSTPNSGIGPLVTHAEIAQYQASSIPAQHFGTNDAVRRAVQPVLVSAEEGLEGTAAEVEGNEEALMTVSSQADRLMMLAKVTPALYMACNRMESLMVHVIQAWAEG